MMLRFTLVFMTMLLFTNAFNVTEVEEAIVEMLGTETHPEGDDKPHAFFIRLAWHCSGTYRTSDGRGGCEGARIMHPPELNWGSNTNLEQATSKLQDIKDAYGEDLSWSDLIILTGNTAIKDMGGPTIPFCQGRQDGTAEGKDHAMELDNDEIYLPADTFNASKVRKSFEIMDMNDRETVALIGGGHAFGKTHLDTSGFGGPWTASPFVWTNQFFQNLLLGEEYSEIINAKGNIQFNNNNTGLMMLATDFALLMDIDYLHLVTEYAEDLPKLTQDFGAAWHKLTTSDLGGKYESMCAGGSPIEPTVEWDIDTVKTELKTLFQNESADSGHYGPFFVRLAWHCTGTFRSTDFRGGCNGARIRWKPEIEWGSNAALDQALKLLEPIQESHTGLSWADLIVLAGSTAIEDMGGRTMPFCGGRTDGTEEDALKGSAYLNEQIYLDAEIGTAEEIKETMRIMGFNAKEMTVLNGGGHAVGKTHESRSGFEGPWTNNPSELSNEFFRLLLDEEWVETTDGNINGLVQFKVKDSDSSLMMLQTDIRFKEDPEFLEHVTYYASNNDAFLDDFAVAWLKLVNSDRFNTNCPDFSASPTAPPTPKIIDGPTHHEDDPHTHSDGVAGLDIMLACIVAFFTLLLN